MKHLSFLTLALALCLGDIHATEWVAVASNEETPTFSFDAGGFVKTSDFENASSGLFVGVHGYPKPFTENLGLFAEGRFYDNKGTFIDEGFGGLLFSVHEGPKASLSLYGGAGLNFEESISNADRNDILIGAGIRWDTQLFDSPLHLGVRAGWEKQLMAEADHQAIGAGFLSLKF
jgi:hypothetical protein